LIKISYWLYTLCVTTGDKHVAATEINMKSETNDFQKQTVPQAYK